MILTSLKLTTFVVIGLWLGGPAFGVIYTDSRGTFSVSYDEKTWKVDEGKHAHPPKEKVDATLNDRTLVNLERVVSDEKYHARFSVVADPLAPLKLAGSPENKLSGYYKHSKKFLTDQKFNVVSEKEPGKSAVEGCYLENLNKPCYEIIVKQRDFGLTLRQIVFLEGDHAYLLTGASRISKFDNYAPEFKALFDSFRFLTPSR